MIENHRDISQTKIAYEEGFLHPPSWISVAGHVYRASLDVSRIRDQVRLDARDICALCGERVRRGDGDMDHIRGGLGPQRCDCYETTLANGSLCTNLRWLHKTCHRRKHDREVKWTPKV